MSENRRKGIECRGIELEIIQVGAKAKPCTACSKCLETGSGHCVQKDEVNDWIDKMVEADGIILASPVYYGGIAGGMKCFLTGHFLQQATGCTIKSGRRSLHCAGQEAWRLISSLTHI